MSTRLPNTVWVVAVIALSMALVMAFSGANTGARSVNVAVVTDADAYLAIVENGNGDFGGFVSVASGKTVLTFDATTSPSGGGTGINPGSNYTFDAILNITNKGTSTVTVGVTIDDNTKCEAAFTDLEAQAIGDYATAPSRSMAAGEVDHLGLMLKEPNDTTSGSAEWCTITLVVDNS